MAKKKVHKVSQTYKTKMAIALRGTDAWHEWVKGLAEFDHGKTIPQMIEEALRRHAKALGYKAVYPNRIER